MAASSRIWRAWSAPAVLFVTVITFAGGSSSIGGVKREALSLRWAALFLLSAIAIALAAPRVRERPTRFVILPAIFLALAVLSTTWSVAPRITFERTGTLGVLFLAASAVAHACRRDDDLRRRMLLAPGAAAGAIALCGFVMLLLGDHDAVQQAAVQSPWRFRGFGENPNTIPLLAAVALPGVGWAVVRTRGPQRVWWVVAAAALLGTCIATESRGGLVGAFLGLAFVFAGLVPKPMHKIGAVATVAGLCAAGLVLRASLQPPPPPGVRAGPPPAVSGSGHHGIGRSGASELPARNEEIGHPRLGYAPTTAGSGRVGEWGGVLEVVRERPLLGFGFGTEPIVFVDRWYYFDGGTAENSFLGTLLQLGLFGFVVLVSIGLGLAVHGLRVLRTLAGEAREAVIVGLGVLVGAATLMMIQSYVYSVGNVASVTLWISLFLIGDVVWAMRRAGAGVTSVA